MKKTEKLSPWEQTQAKDIPTFNLTLNKPNLNAQVQQIVGRVKKGNVNPLEAFIFLNFMQKVADEAKKQLLEQAIAEAEKYPEKEAEIYNAVVTIKNGAGRYTYPDSIKEAQEQAKAACKAKEKGQVLTDEETGEIIEPATYTQGKTILNIKFK